MLAIIIAAGLGSRLEGLTKDRPKCLVPFRGKPMIEHQIDAYRAAGVSDIVFVTGYKAEQLQYPGIKTYLNDDFRNNNILLSLMYAAAEFHQDLLISYSDIVYEKWVVNAALDTPGDIAVVCDADWAKVYEGRTLHPVEQAENVVIERPAGAPLEKGLVKKIGKYVPAEEADAEFIGLFRLSASGARRFRATYDEVKATYTGKPFGHAPVFAKAYVTDLFEELICRGEKIVPAMIRGGWREIDTPQDLERASAELAIG